MTAFFTSPFQIITAQGNNSLQFESDCDCDCACEQSAPWAVPQVDVMSGGSVLFQKAIESNSLLIDGNYLCFGPNHYPTVLNAPAYALWDAFREPGHLPLLPDEQLVLQKFLELGLVVPASYPHPTKIRPPLSLLTAWLHITDKCNLRCAYCYLPHRSQNMAYETGVDAVESVFRSALLHHYQGVKLKYAGGEPLLYFERVKQLHQYAQVLAMQHQLKLDAVLLTNGTLLSPDTIKTLSDLDIRLMVSLDGVDVTHDRQRAFSDAKSSAKLVCEGVDMALHGGLKPQISVTVSSQSASGLADLVNWLIDRDLPFSFNFYRENPFSLAKAQLQFDEKVLVAGLQAAFDVLALRLPQYSLLSMLTDRANLAIPRQHTCAAGHDYLVIRSDGQIAKCQMAMGQVCSHIQSPDPLADIRRDNGGIQNYSVDEKEECQKCVWRYWCCGGCPLMAMQTSGEYNAPSPYCQVYKQIFPKVLQLEGMRLIKQAIL